MPNKILKCIPNKFLMTPYNQSVRCDAFLPARTHFAPDNFCPHALRTHACFLPHRTPHPHLKIFYIANFYIFLLVTVKGIM